MTAVMKDADLSIGWVGEVIKCQKMPTGDGKENRRDGHVMQIGKNNET
jgi:hypothetical protein